MVVTEEEAAANRSADTQEERTWVSSSEIRRGMGQQPRLFDGLLGRDRSRDRAPASAGFSQRGRSGADGRPRPLPTLVAHGTTPTRTQPH